MTGALYLVCRKCTREARFQAVDKEQAAKVAMAAGWAMPKQGLFVCPRCPK